MLTELKDFRKLGYFSELARLREEVVALEKHSLDKLAQLRNELASLERWIKFSPSTEKL